MMRSFVAATFILAAVPSFAAETTPSDDQIRTKVQRKLADEDVNNVQVEVKNRAVVLHGTVPSIGEAQRAMETVQDVDEVEAVTSDLRVVTGTVGDEALAREVASRLVSYASYDVFDSVSASVQNGVVTLSGFVTNGYKATDMEERAAKVEGVRQVINDIQTLTPSPMDDELRVRIASAIYGDSVFTRYTAGGNPPIHVVVDHGRVTLAGVVASSLERQKAEMIARSIPGSFAVTNQLAISRD